MTFTLRNIKIAAFGVLIVGVAIFSAVSVVKANPSFFLRTQMAAATSTQNFFLKGGVSTTTLTLDLGQSGAQAADSAALFIQFTSTTSQPTLVTDIQYSQDGVDWYETPIGWNTNLYASSTPNLGIVESSQLVFASSTASRGASVSNASNGAATTTRMLLLATPTRYIRAVFYETAGSGQGGLWAELIAKRQAAN